MKKIGTIFLLLVTLVLSESVLAQETVPPIGANFQPPFVYPVMRPDLATLRKWIDDYENAPKAEIDPVVQSSLLQAQVTGTPTSLSLPNYIQYTPSERNQGYCGDCWVWASTGVMEIALSVQSGISNRLSTQFLNSCDTNAYACCGGSLTGFSNWYGSTGYAIPWSNTNAFFQDGSDSSCSSTVPCGNISTAPDYPISSISSQTVPTTGYLSDSTPIANIMNILNQGRGVYYGFFLANQTDWNGFYDFWDNNGEAVIWDPDPYCNHVYHDSTGGGHAVLIVGYDDSSTDPTQQYWIVLNSWGTGWYNNRPNGLFRMKMHMNYNCSLSGFGYSRQFQTLNMAFNPSSTTIYVSPTGCGSKTPCYSSVQNAIDSVGLVLSINISENANSEDVISDTPKTLTLRGGWDSTFSSQPSSTTIHSLTIAHGMVTVERIILR